MKLTCFITVCACLSSTVFTDEIKRLNKIKKVPRLREELPVKDATTRREINSTPQIYPSTYPTRQLQPPIEKPTKNSQRNHEFQSGPQQQQQQHHYNRGRSRYPMKHVKTRSIIGSSTYELNDNQLDSSPEVIHDEEPIRIEPMYRVTKKNVLDSIFDILQQLMNPSKGELGPLVPIQMPGSKRKIYLRLIEPLDASQVIVRFVTQLPVPVIDAEKQYNPFIPIPSIIDPTAMLLHHAHHGTIHPTSGDALYASSSNRHHAVYPPRNVSHAKGPSKSTKPLAENSSQNSTKESPDKESFSSTVASNEVDNDKNRFTNTRVNLQNHEQQLLSESAASYYQYQAAGEEVMNKVKEFLEKENATVPIESENNLQNPPVEPWYQLSTHRLPFRQVAPYPFASIEHDSSSNSYVEPYKAPTTHPSSYSTYEQYNDVANSPPGYYPSSYNAPNSYSTPYKQNEIHDIPYHKQNEFTSVLSSYPISYQNQNEFNGSPNSYSVSYQSQNEFNSAPNSYATPYGKDLFSASSTYSSSYEKPTNVPSSPNSYEKQPTVVQSEASFNDAFQIIDPPSYLPGYRTENHANRSFEHTITTMRQPRYNNPYETVDSSSTGGESASPVIWGKSKREKSESSFQKSAEITGIDHNRERWQPVVSVHENWRETDLAKPATTERQPLLENRPTRKPSRGDANQARRNSKHRDGAILVVRDPRCSTSAEEQNGCERAKSTTTSTPRSESTVRIVEKQTQATVNNESISIAKSVTNNTIEILKPNVTTKSSTTERSSTVMTTTTTKSAESMSGTTEGSLSKVIKKGSTTTEKSSLLIKAIESAFMNSIADRLIATEANLTGPTASNVTQKSTSNMTERPSNTTKKSTSNTTEKPSSTTKKSSTMTTKSSNPTVKSNINTTAKSSNMTVKSSNMTVKSSNTTVKSSATTEKSLINSATRQFESSKKARKLELPKRPMVMKKMTHIVKRPELNSTTRRTVTTVTTTQKPTTKKTTVIRKSTKFSRTISKTKSNTT